MKLDKTFENDIKKLNGNGSREAKFEQLIGSMIFSTFGKLGAALIVNIATAIQSRENL